MSINLDDIYIERLEKYVGKKIKIFKKENEIEFYYDVEMQYILEEKDKVYYFYSVERGKRSEIAKYFSEKEMKRRIAINIKGFFGGTIDYNNLEKFRNIKNFEKGKELMSLYMEPEYYSIMEPKAIKINLEQGDNDDTYNIYFLSNKNEKKYIEKNADISFAFFRFYAESYYLKRSLKRMKEYEAIFEDKIEEKKLYGLIVRNI